MATEDLTGKKVTLDLSAKPDLPADYQTFKEVATRLEVIDDESYRIATAMVLKEDEWGRAVDSFFDKGREQAHTLHKWFTSTISSLKSGYAVRTTLIPRMKAYDLKKARLKAEAEAKQRQEDEQKRLAAEAEARRIQKEAEDKAEALRLQGQMRQAREVVAEATQQAEQVVAVAESLEDLGTILPDDKVAGGPGKSMPWTAEMIEYEDDPDRAIMETIKAIASGAIPLRYAMPVRGEKGKYSQEPLVEIVPAVLKEIGKRLARENIGIPGAIGKREVQLRFSKSAAPGKSEDEW